MQRLSGIVLAGALLLLLMPALSQTQGTAFAQTTFNSEFAVMAVTIKSTGTADYEMILDRLQEALSGGTPEQRRQAAGWRVIKASTAQPNGDIIYMHLIDVVRGADYGVMAALYEAFPEERQVLYETYQAAFSAVLFALEGNVQSDMGQ